MHLIQKEMKFREAKLYFLKKVTARKWEDFDRHQVGSRVYMWNHVAADIHELRCEG